MILGTIIIPKSRLFLTSVRKGFICHIPPVWLAGSLSSCLPVPPVWFARSQSPLSPCAFCLVCKVIVTPVSLCLLSGFQGLYSPCLFPPLPSVYNSLSFVLNSILITSVPRSAHILKWLGLGFSI